MTQLADRRGTGMKLRGGYTNYGQDIGVLMLDTRFPRPRGDIGNARTFDFPVRFKVVKGAKTSRIMGDEPDAAPVAPFIDAVRERAAVGAGAITASRGFLAPFQRRIAEAVAIETPDYPAVDGVRCSADGRGNWP
jgi:hypothetical protein